MQNRNLDGYSCLNLSGKVICGSVHSVSNKMGHLISLSDRVFSLTRLLFQG